MIIYVLFIFFVPHVLGFRCERRPYGSNTQSSEPDGRFKLEVVGLETNAYIPGQLYTVQLTQTDDVSRFTSFMISIEGDAREDPRNPRRTLSLDPGELRPVTTTTAKFSDRCPYSVEQSMTSSKSSVEVYWQAPYSGNGCVSLRAMVAENDALWFEDGGPLTKKLCEDMRQPDDVAPLVNSNCGVCDEAKYELTFEGIWSRNTHPYLYPENDWRPKYSDLVGASHMEDYILWIPGGLATDGFKDMAEHANTSNLEAEILQKIGSEVRTMIKGKGHGYRKMSLPTYSFFRADRVNHLLSAVVGLSPSPDWFLGVSRFELCQDDNTWLPERELNLYPWDAGTDSGASYESPNIVTFPQSAISRVAMSSYDKDSPFYEMDIKDMHPFGKFHIKLIRTYHRECPETTTEEGTTDEGGEGEGGEGSEEKSGEEGSEEPESKEPQPPSRYQTDLDSSEDGGSESSEVTVTEAPVDCPMSNWLQWSMCEGECVDGRIQGYRWRERYHLVDGVAVEKYDPAGKHGHQKKPPVPPYCKTNFLTFEEVECEDECTVEIVEEDEVTEQWAETDLQENGTKNEWLSKFMILDLITVFTFFTISIGLCAYTIRWFFTNCCNFY
ncbi:spondin-1-like isoform X2 [Anticarsia gemmatalis]|uniref:spondin-1-like isoform X2 n=1 Tax=Anticarsia gemmatalis TaxID=129554 RepID=UPI003F76F9AD